MTNRLVPFLAFVLFLSLAALLVEGLFRSDPPPAGPSRTTLAAASEMPGVTKTPEGDGPVLRMAVLASASRGDSTAIVGVREVPAEVRERLDVPFTGTRVLLPEFDPVVLGGEARLYRVGFRGEFAVVRASWNLDLNAPVSGTRSGGGRYLINLDYPERWVVRTGEPLVRIGDNGDAALFAVILERERAVETDGGTLAFWRGLFRKAGKRPFLDEADVAATAAPARPKEIPESDTWGAGAQAPLNAALGLWMLGDQEGLGELRARVNADAGFLERALVSMRRDRHDEEWVRQDPIFALQILGVLPFDGRRVQSAVDENVGPGVNLGGGGAWRLRRSSPVRTFRLLDDPVADEIATHALEDFQRREPDERDELVAYEFDPSGDIGRYVLEHDSPADRPAVVAAWEAARRQFLATLPRTLRLKRGEPAVLTAILLLLAVGSFLFALIRRGSRVPLRIKVVPIVGIYVVSLVGVNHVEAGPVLAPTWIVLSFLWLRSDVSHPWWERMAIGIALNASTLRMVFLDQVELIHPALEVIARGWYGFGWLVLGRVVLTMPEHRHSKPFRAFLTLHVFTVVQYTGAILTGEVDKAGPAVLTTIGVAAAALLWFSLEEPVRRLRARFRRN